MPELCDNTREKKSCKRHKPVEPEQQFQSKAAPICQLIQAHADAQVPPNVLYPDLRVQPPSNAIAQGGPIPFTDTDYMSCVSSIKLDSNIFQIADCGVYSINYCVQVINSDAAIEAVTLAEEFAASAADAQLALEAAQLALVAQKEAYEATFAALKLAQETYLKATYASVAAALVAGSTIDPDVGGITDPITGVNTTDNRVIARAAAAEADLAADALDAAIIDAKQKVTDAATASAAAETAAGQTGNATLMAAAAAAAAAAEIANTAELAGLDFAEPVVIETHNAAMSTRDAVSAVEEYGSNSDESKDAANAALNATSDASEAFRESRDEILKAVAYAIPKAISTAVALVTAAETLVTSATDAAKKAKAAAEQEASAVVLRYKVPNCWNISPCGDCPPIEQYTNTGWTTLECSRGFLVSTQLTGSISGQYQLEIKHRCILVGLFNDTQSDSGELLLNPDKLPNTYINMFRVATYDDCCYVNSCDK